MLIGKIAVDRMVNGELKSLTLNTYKEWYGCYTQIFWRTS